MAGWDVSAATVVLLAVPAMLWSAGRLRLQSRGVRWPARRDAAFLVGLVCIAAAIASPVAAYDERFPVHVVQHLLLGMAAPLAFALAAPITLALRAAPVPVRRRLVGVLRSRPVGVLSWAPVGAVLSVGLMWPLYLSPLYAATLRHPLLHEAVHAHMMIAGCLFVFALVGADPMPGRGSTVVRIASLGAALGAHDILAKYLYLHPSGHGDAAASWRTGAQILWYGGEAFDVLVAAIFFARWYAAGGRRLARDRRRASKSLPALHA